MESIEGVHPQRHDADGTEPITHLPMGIVPWDEGEFTAVLN